MLAYYSEGDRSYKYTVRGANNCNGSVLLANAICYRPSVCRLSVTFVRPTQAVQFIGNRPISMALGTVAIH